MTHPFRRVRRACVAIALVSFVGALAPVDPAFASGQATPPARDSMGMTYDVAHREVVLFGGFGRKGWVDDTWTWDGTTWTRRQPATSPPGRYLMGMTYDAASGVVVLFGGSGHGDTWTWDGTAWTQHHPPTSPSPRALMGMTYDAARSEVALFGGAYECCFLNDTWTWDGMTWTQRHPPVPPPYGGGLGMTYDSARSEVVLFGSGGNLRDDTWIWDGTNWSQRYPVSSPSARGFVGMTDDAARGEVVLFGGCCQGGGDLGDTWTWDGTNWRVAFVPHLDLSPASGPPGTTVNVTARGFAAREEVTVTFIDSVRGKTTLGTFLTGTKGGLSARVTIPSPATVGAQKITAVGEVSHQKAKATFTVT
jgi:hypothetical protein